MHTYFINYLKATTAEARLALVEEKPEFFTLEAVAAIEAFNNRIAEIVNTLVEDREKMAEANKHGLEVLEQLEKTIDELNVKNSNLTAENKKLKEAEAQNADLAKQVEELKAELAKAKA